MIVSSYACQVLIIIELSLGMVVALVIKMDSLKDKIKDMEREEIVNALKDSNGVMAKAARKLGITERMIGYKIKKYGIKTEVKFNHSIVEGQ
jgi:Nif-specific regulatory protein